MGGEQRFLAAEDPVEHLAPYRCSSPGVAAP
jgi:hypothetical protein